MTYHEFFDTWNLREYLSDPKRQELAGSKLNDLLERLNKYEEKGYEALQLKTLGYLNSDVIDDDIFFKAKQYAYRINDGDVYAKIYCIIAKDTTVTDALGKTVYETPDGILFTIDIHPGNPYSLGSIILQRPEFNLLS